MTTKWWIGSYGSDMDGTSEGISLAQSRPDGSLELVGLAASILSPTFIASRGNTLYAAAEGLGRIEAYRIVGDTLESIGGVSSGGGYPCQLEFIEGGLVAANYEGGELGVISNDLVLEQVVPSHGSGPHPEQAGPHAHRAFRLNETTLLSADLGADRVFVHSIEGGRITRTGEAVLPPGTGPRDIELHPSGLIYVLGEHGRDLHVFEWLDEELVPVTSAALPGALENDQAAAVRFGADGRFVYAGLRGSNLIAVLEASDDGRTLTPVASVSTAGDWPRNLIVDGDLLHVANQRSNTIASFRLGSDGIPVLIAEPTPFASPTYLLAHA